VKIAIGSDHHGVAFKQQAADFLQTLGMNVVDVGAHDAVEPCDYPDSARKVGQLVSTGAVDRGLLICGSGVGMAITANKFPKVRAAVCDSVELAKLTRQHNGINVLCLSGNQWKQQDLRPVVEAFVETEFEGGRHQRRIDKISEIETEIGAARIGAE
jgi:ribose 5-phosphate isomerase B